MENSSSSRPLPRSGRVLLSGKSHQSSVLGTFLKEVLGAVCALPWGLYLTPMVQIHSQVIRAVAILRGE